MKNPILNLRTVAGALCAALFVSAAGAQAPLNVPLAFVGDAATSAHAGASQGLSEARLQGEFLGQQYRLDATPADAAAIIAALPATALVELARQYPDKPVLNIAASDDALRDDCTANLLHVLPSARMTRDATAQWQQHKPGATVEARAWHPDFEKYAAAQLNKRYVAQFGQPMDDQAWAGWAAVKMLSDTVAREQTAASATLLDALRQRLAFDGQKGVDMSFRDDGQLRQPLLLVDANGIVGEAPVRGVVDTDDLDSLGPSTCHTSAK